MKKILSIIFLLVLLAYSSLYAGGYLGEFQIGDTVYFTAAFNDTTGTQYEDTANTTGRLYRGGTYVAAPVWAELDDANLVGVWQTSQDTTAYTAGQYTMIVWGTIDAGKIPQTTLTFNLYAATGKQVDLTANAVDDVLNEEVDNDGAAISLRGAMKLMLTVLTGKTSGGGTANLIFRDIADTKNRVTVTVTSVGNRTSVTRDAD